MLRLHNGLQMEPGFSSCGEEKTLRVWDLLSGEELWCISEGAPILAVGSPDEKSILAINNEENIVKVWETATGFLPSHWISETLRQSLKINSIDWNPWSPDGDRFLIYSKEGNAANMGCTIWENLAYPVRTQWLD